MVLKIWPVPFCRSRAHDKSSAAAGTEIPLVISFGQALRSSQRENNFHAIEAVYQTVGTPSDLP
ncbi:MULTISPECIES: hypothetical protein [unclassified Streptomyces]|uniref:hypothetical protein n=1 Tax=unclassified Streptomyces TaxID=2593676 RepID=UPI0038684343|nr:hypothetical protein OG569_03260 [Streptomyces sp. NBC_00827]